MTAMENTHNNKKAKNFGNQDGKYRLFFFRSIAQFFTQIYMNCFVKS